MKIFVRIGIGLRINELNTVEERSIQRVTQIRAADAKEVGVENPAEETFCRPNQVDINSLVFLVNPNVTFVSLS